MPYSKVRLLPLFWPLYQGQGSHNLTYLFDLFLRHQNHKKNLWKRIANNKLWTHFLAYDSPASFLTPRNFNLFLSPKTKCVSASKVIFKNREKAQFLVNYELTCVWNGTYSIFRLSCFFFDPMFRFKVVIKDCCSWSNHHGGWRGVNDIFKDGVINW